MGTVPMSHWTGSETTSEQVRKQIVARWGEDEARNYDPHTNCFTFGEWLDSGFVVKKGEKALKSFIMVGEKDKDGKIVGRRPKTINLFYYRQIEELFDVDEQG